MEADPHLRPNPRGYVITLIGIACFALGNLLPLYELSSANLRPSRYDLVTMIPSFASRSGGLLALFGGAAAIAVIAILGLRRPRAWTLPALVAGSVVWALVEIGTLLSAYHSASPPLAGFWVMGLGVTVVIVGTSLVWVDAQRSEVAAVHRHPAEEGVAR